MLELPGYIIEKQIGKGGMAKVYLALHEGLDRHVAIKVMSKHLGDDDSNFGERFIHEARTVAKLSQQNIVNVFDVGEHDGYNYIAMELLPGITLDDKIKDGLSHSDAISILKQMAAALNYAHQKDIVHRDVKPENIMFREDGSVVLTDFGIAKSTTANNKMTATGTVIGTPHYMSPEQAQGIEIGPFADIYSLGIVFYEMLKGEVPYDADSTIAVAFKHITEPVPELGDDLKEYQFLLNGMMAKDLDERYHSGQDIISDIETLERNETPDNATKVFRKTAINKAATQLNKAAGRKTKPQQQQEEKKSKTPFIAGIAATLIIAASTGGYVYYDNQNEAQAKLVKEQQLAKQAEKQKAELLAQKERGRLKTEQAQKLAQRKSEEESESQRLKTEAAQQKSAELNKKKKEQNKIAQLKIQKRNKKIEDILKQAETDLLNSKLNDAYKKYNSVLKISTNNKFAKNGINRIADQYLALANNEALKANYDQANKYIASVIQIAPTHKKLASTQQKVFDLKNQQLAKQAEEQRAAQELERKRLLEQQAQNKQTEGEPVKEKKRRSFGGF